jgi:hypothetical protein
MVAYFYSSASHAVLQHGSKNYAFISLIVEIHVTARPPDLH